MVASLTIRADGRVEQATLEALDVEVDEDVAEITRDPATAGSIPGADGS